MEKSSAYITKKTKSKRCRSVMENEISNESNQTPVKSISKESTTKILSKTNSNTPFKRRKLSEINVESSVKSKDILVSLYFYTLIKNFSTKLTYQLY